jgi:DNA-binding MarR family transcriptional regulator
MAETVTQEQVLDAIRSLGEEFTRSDVAEKLGIEISAMQPSWKAVKEAGQIEKVRNEDGKRFFRLADK